MRAPAARKSDHVPVTEPIRWMKSFELTVTRTHCASITTCVTSVWRGGTRLPHGASAASFAFVSSDRKRGNHSSRWWPMWSAANDSFVVLTRCTSVRPAITRMSNTLGFGDVPRSPTPAKCAAPEPLKLAYMPSVGRSE